MKLGQIFVFAALSSLLCGCGHSVMLEHEVTGFSLRIPVAEGADLGLSIGVVKSTMATIRGGTSLETVTSAGGGIFSGDAGVNKITTFKTNTQLNEGNLVKVMTSPNCPDDAKIALASNLCAAVKAPKFASQILQTERTTIHTGAEAIQSNAVERLDCKPTGIDRLGDNVRDVANTTVHETAGVANNTVNQTANVATNTVVHTADVINHTVDKTSDVANHTVDKTTDVVNNTVDKTVDVVEHTEDAVQLTASDWIDAIKDLFSPLKSVKWIAIVAIVGVVIILIFLINGIFGLFHKSDKKSSTTQTTLSSGNDLNDTVDDEDVIIPDRTDEISAQVKKPSIWSRLKAIIEVFFGLFARIPPEYKKQLVDGICKWVKMKKIAKMEAQKNKNKK